MDSNIFKPERRVEETQDEYRLRRKAAHRINASMTLTGRFSTQTRNGGHKGGNRRIQRARG